MRRLNDHRNIFDVAESLSGPHSGNLFSAVGIGVIVAAALAIYGLTCVITQEATFFGGRPIKFAKYSGTPAMSLGIAYISVALFMHSHFTWSSSDRHHVSAQVGKLISAAAVVMSIGYLVFYVAAVM